MRETAAAAAPAPPSTNRGVETPDDAGQSPVVVDWVGFTSRDELGYEDLMPGSEDWEWTELAHGAYGYANAIRCGHITYFFNGRDGMGTHVEISGQGCREAEASGLVRDWGEFFDHLIDQGVTFSRLHLALDDHSGRVTCERVVEAIDHGHYASRWHRDRIRFQRGPSGVAGYSIDLGSRLSDCRLTIYDKAAEQGLTDGAVWTRVELKAADEIAQGLAEAIALLPPEDVRRHVAGVIRGRLDFKRPAGAGVNGHTYRTETATWWREFLEGAGRLQLGKPSSTLHPVDAKEHWLRTQVARSLATVVEARRGDLAVVRELLREGKRKLRRRDRQAAASWAARAA